MEYYKGLHFVQKDKMKPSEILSCYYDNYLLLKYMYFMA